jgi:DNA-binding response OmpR family regulator
MTQRVPAILVLEDEEEVRKTISATLSDAGFQVETAVTGWEAIALIELRRFDMVVAGINLPCAPVILR